MNQQPKPHQPFSVPGKARRALPVLGIAGLLLCVALAARAETDVSSQKTDYRLFDADEYERSSAVYPPQELPIRFSHDVHVHGEGMSCVTCHSDALTSIRTSDRLLPPMTVCLDCHQLEADYESANRPADESDSEAQSQTTLKAECSTCHAWFDDKEPEFPDGVDAPGRDNYFLVLNPPPRPVIPAANLRFSHRLHTDADVGCQDCHGDMRGVDLASRDNLPLMGDCLDCHDNENPTPEDCQTCHLAQENGLLRTQFDSGVLEPTGRFRNDDHRLDILERHASPARGDEDYCAACHSESWCADCHNGVVKPLTIHPPNYVALHGLDAMQSSGECESCHTGQDFCVGCHEATGVGEGEGPPVGAMFHPAGFVDDVGSPDFHGPIASRNMDACVSCHQEDTCITCHSGINPHPPGFMSKCGAMMERNDTACAKCHLDLQFIRQVCQ